MNVAQWLSTYGYGAVLLSSMIESIGIPFPGETMLLVAAIAAGTTHQLAIPLVIVAAVSGAILGDNLGFWIGHKGGYYRVRRYGRYVRLDERKLKLGQYLFLKHGGKVVFGWHALSPFCERGRRFWRGPIRCAGPVFCSSTRVEVSCGLAWWDWAATFWVTPFIG